MKNGKPLFHHVLCHVPCWKKELPDGDRRQGRRNHATGPWTRTQRTRATDRGYPTVSQIHGASLLRMLVLTLLKNPQAKTADFQSTAAQLGLHVSSTAIDNRFTPQLMTFLHAVLEQTVHRAWPRVPAVDLLNKFTSVRIGDSSTIPLPDELADQFPGCGGNSGSGRAAMKIHLLWDFLTGSILQLRITPGSSSDATNPIAQEVSPPGRCRCSTWVLLSGSIRELDAGRRFLDLAAAAWHVGLRRRGPPLSLLQYLRQPTGSGPIDVSVPLGVTHRLPCRLIALRVPARSGRPAATGSHEKAQKHGRVPSREYLEWQDWTIFVTNCQPELLTWQAVVVLYRARWQIELMFKLWKSHNRLATHGRSAAGSVA